MRFAKLVILVLAAALAAGCGSSGSTGRADRTATLMLDFTPNAVHAGIYSALARHYDRDEGVKLQIEVPGASTDSIKLLEAGRVKFAILDIHDLAIARAQGADLVGVMAIVERPLAAVVAAPDIRTPRQLEGKTVGITGDPSDTAVLDSIVAGSGGNPAKVRRITIGYNAVPDLLAGRIAAATSFWSDEGITLAQDRPGFHSFRVEDYGAPAYPELVLCVTGSTLRRDPGLVGAVVRTIAYGYDFTERDPKRSAADLEERVQGLDPKLVAAQLDALLPAFRGPGGEVGELDMSGLRAWAVWEARFGIVRSPPDVAKMFDPSFVPSAAAGP